MPTASSLATPRILVLSGGGGSGSAQAAAVLELYRQGFVPDLIIGTSIGAWNGAYLAAHPGVEGATELCRLWRDGAFFQMASPRGVQLAKAAVLRRPTLIPPESIDRALVRTGIATQQWSDVRIPLIVGAVDAVTLTLHYWSERTAEGPIAPYVSASSALAPLLPFGLIKGRQYVDAGMQDNYGIPEVVNRLASTGAKNATLLVIDCSPSAPQHRADNVAKAADVALGATFRRHRDDGVALATAAGHRVEIIEVGGNHAISDFMDPEAGMVVGREAVRAWAAGTPEYPAWPQTSFLRRVKNVVAFTVDDILSRFGLRRGPGHDREIA